jgi:hypothetical protein
MMRLWRRRDGRRRDVAPVVAVVGTGLFCAVPLARLLPVATVVLIAVGGVAAIALTTRKDEITVLSIFFITLFVVPANLAFGPLGAAGTPSTLVCDVMLILWLLALLSRRMAPSMPRRIQPLHVAIGFYVFANLLGYLAGLMRSMPADEASAADRGLLGIAAVAGLVLFTADTVRTRRDIDLLLGRMVLGGCVVSLVGVVQFLGFDLAAAIHVPGLTRREVIVDQARGDFIRVYGTATHAIEFGVVLSMIFLIALHRALYAPPERSARRWLAVVVVGAGIPLAIARSAVITILVGLVVLGATWTIRRMVNAAFLALPALIALQIAVPGLLSTIKNLFLHAGGDASIEGRTGDYAVVGRYFAERPLFGRGLGTFLPSRYIILDNEYLFELVTVGLLGVAATLTLFVVACSLARGARRRAVDEETRHLGQTLVAVLCGAGVAAATFDAFGFAVMFGVTFFTMGMCGALWRVQRESPTASPTPSSAVATKATTTVPASAGAGALRRRADQPLQRA